MLQFPCVVYLSVVEAIDVEEIVKAVKSATMHAPTPCTGTENLSSQSSQSQRFTSSPNLKHLVVVEGTMLLHIRYSDELMLLRLV